MLMGTDSIGSQHWGRGGQDCPKALVPGTKQWHLRPKRSPPKVFNLIRIASKRHILASELIQHDTKPDIRIGGSVIRIIFLEAWEVQVRGKSSLRHMAQWGFRLSH